MFRVAFTRALSSLRYRAPTPRGSPRGAARPPNLWTLCAELPRYGAPIRFRSSFSALTPFARSRAGLNKKVYRQSWADKGYDPSGHHYLITRIGLRNQIAWGYRCWKGKVDAAPTTIKQPTKREWLVLPET